MTAPDKRLTDAAAEVDRLKANNAALVEALKEALADIARHDPLHMDSRDPKLAWPSVPKIRALIAKHGGG